MTGIRTELNLKIAEKSDEFMKQLLARSMLEVQNLAKIKAPVDTGFLRNSIQMEIITDTRIYVTSYASYSYFMEYGTYKMTPKPFMRPALDEVRAKRIKQIAKELN